MLLGVSFYFLFFMFSFCATLLIATEHHNDVEIEPISNYSTAHLKNFNCRLERSMLYFWSVHYASIKWYVMCFSIPASSPQNFLELTI